MSCHKYPCLAIRSSNNWLHMQSVEETLPGHELGVDQVCQVSSYGQSGLSFRRILENPGVHIDHILTGDRQPDLLIVDVGSNDLTPIDTSVITVVNDALEFLSVLESYQVFPKVVVFMSVIQRISMGHRGGGFLEHV